MHYLFTQLIVQLMAKEYLMPLFMKLVFSTFYKKKLYWGHVKTKFMITFNNLVNPVSSSLRLVLIPTLHEKYA